ncbi:MAG: ATP-binding protein [Actinomycetota bacterium]
MAGLLAGVGSAVSGRGRVFLIAGEPGIGKSRLADEVAWHAEQRGMRVLWGRCWEAGGAPAYWPWVQSIRSYIRGVEARAVEAQLGAGGPHVARLVPEVRELVPGLPEPPGPDVEGDRFLLFDAIAQFLRAAADVQPIVLVLDDLHAADPSSLLLLEFVAGEAATAPILLLGLYRDTDLRRTHPLRPALSGLSRYRWTRQLALRGLTELDVARYIEAATGLVPGRNLISAVHEGTEGNPLFVGELVHLLADEGRLASAGDEGYFRLAVPEGVREVIGRRLDRLSDRCRGVLLVASVPGREFSLEVLQALIDLSPEALLRHLDEAREARVVHEVPGGPRRWRFAHALIRDTLYDDLTAVRRQRLHRKVGEALEAQYRSDLEPHTAELAHHFFESATAGDAERAARYAERAAARAAELLAYEEAVRLYRMALLALDRTGSSKARDRCRLLLALGDAWARGGDLDQAKETFLQAAEEARNATSPELVAAAALGYGGRFVWARAGDDRRLVPLLEDALSGLSEEDGPQRVRLLARLAGALRDQPDRELAARLSRQAVEMARRLADPATLAYALDGLYAAVWWPENPEERLGIATEIVDVAREAGDAERLAEGLDYRICALMELGDVAAADADLATMDGLVGRLRQPAQRWILLHTRACRALFDGRFDEAERLIPEALSSGERAQRWDAVMSFRLQTFLLRKEQGRVREVEELIRHSIAEYPTRPVFRCALAHLHAELGRRPEAHGTFEALAVDDFEGLPRDNDWVLGLSLLPEVAVFLEDSHRAAALYDMLLPYARRFPMWGAEISTGSASRGLGNLASATSRWDAAVLHFEEALEMNKLTGARPWVAHTCHDHARMLLARKRPRDRAQAAELLERARDTCQELGMVALGAKVSALVSEHGLHPKPGSRTRVVSSAPPEDARTAIFRREGEYWYIRFEGDEFRLRNSMGLHYLAELLARPGREVFALDLAAGREGVDRGSVQPGLSASPDPGDAGEVLDREARLAYRRRIEDLQSEIESAEGWHDAERAARATEELDFLAAELASATGLGGRGRRVGSAAERARVNVTRAVRAAMTRIQEHSPALGEHLSRTIRTGTFCSYQPDPGFTPRWRS